MIDSSHPERGNNLDSANRSEGERMAFVKRGEGTMGEGVVLWAGPHSAGGTLASLAGSSAQVSGGLSLLGPATGEGGKHSG